VIVLSHRGYWTDFAERNGASAFVRSFDLGFGTETDIRERNGDLVLSHDMPGQDAMRLADMLDILGRRDLPLALNIKSDGLARVLHAQLKARGLSQWFTFDMSVPEAVVQIRLGMPVFTRASEYERQPVLYDQAIGVWLDAFVSEWYSAADINFFLQDGKRVAIVSPELHARPHLPLWQRLRDSVVKHNPGLMLCTDLPEDARAFFGSKP
jgi:glycerophosphoryl diester phosphodiesterase